MHTEGHDLGGADIDRALAPHAASESQEKNEKELSQHGVRIGVRTADRTPAGADQEAERRAKRALAAEAAERRKQELIERALF